MPSVTGFTAERMLEIENDTVTDGNIVGDDLILVTRGGTQINAGSVRGPQGIVGPVGEVSQQQLDDAIAAAIVTVQAAGAVTNAMIALGAITADRLADGAVTEAKIANGAVTQDKLGALAINNTKLQDNSISTVKLQNASVTNVKLGAGAVDGTKIAANSINSEHYVDRSIDYEHVGFIFVQASQPAGVTGGIWIDT